MKKILAITLTVFVLAAFISCGQKKAEETPKVETPKLAKSEPGIFGIARTSGFTTPQQRVDVAASVKDAEINLKGTEKATIETTQGTIVAELYSKDAPNTVKNFIRLSESGFYDGIIWHRYEPNFVIQGGDPLGNGTGDAGYNIDFEKNSRTHELGALGVARSSDPNSGSCQFYICLSPVHSLDGNYVVFGKVLQGMDVVNKIRVSDTIKKISITQ